MDTFRVRYRFRFPDGTNHHFDLELDEDTLEQVGGAPEALPAWTKLDFHQCPNCPLDPAATPRCPVAVDLVGLVADMGACLSSDEVVVQVTTPERTVIKKTTLQRAVSSLIGFIVATSGCPHTVFFKPMARFHLPLASEEETIYRAASMYLLAQYFMHKRGLPADWDLERLSTLYRDLQIVNGAMARRLRSASDKDAAVNAIVLLDLFAKALPCTIEESLEEIRYLYRSYLNGEVQGAPVPSD